MDVRELRPGLWRWTARHPDWTPEEDDWDQEVACLYVETDEAVVLVDPLVPDGPHEAERMLTALDADVARLGLPLAIVLTLFWHERSAGELASRYGAEIWATVAAVKRLEVRVDRPFAPGDRVAGGIETIDAHRRDEVLLWLPPYRTLVAGDVLLGDEAGGLRVCPDSWLEPG